MEPIGCPEMSVNCVTSQKSADPSPCELRSRQTTLGQSNENTNLMQYCAGFISAGSLYMFRAQAPIIRSI